MTTVLPRPRLLRRPSWALLACCSASFAAVVVLSLPQPNTEQVTAQDVAAMGVFAYPLVLAFLVSSVDHAVARGVAVALAGLAVMLSLAVLAYGLGLLFLPQSAVALGVAIRRTLRED